MSNGKPKLDVGCDFGNVSIGDESARIGITLDRGKVPLEKADEFFSGARLEGSIVLGMASDAPGQKHLAESHSVIESNFDAKKYSVGPKEISTGLTFPLSSIDVKDLAGFAKRSGRICVTRSGSLDDDKPAKSNGDGGPGLFPPHPDVEAGKDRPVGAPGLTAAAQEFKRRKGDKGYSFDLTILTKKKLKNLAVQNGQTTEAGITESKCELIVEALGCKTVAALEKVIATNAFWHRDVKGCGQKVIDELTDALVAFRRIYPVPGDEPEQEEAPKVEEIPTVDALAAAYKKGCEAALAKKNKNPFKAGTSEAQRWIDGWTETNNQSEGSTILDDENTEEVEDEE